MKRVILIAFILISATQLSNAQINFGIKAGVNYNDNNFQNVKKDVFSGGKSTGGYHAGIWLRASLGGFYIRPELIYTEMYSTTKYTPYFVVSTLTKGANFKFRKVDVPVLFGKNFFGVLNAFAGPSFQYIIDSNFNLSQLKYDNMKNKFSVGLQAGLGVEFRNFGLDVRWERAFTDSEMNFIDNSIRKTEVNFDNRVNQVILGLSYQF